ncbi:MAG: helix-turn-helix transcriptional regulator [Spirochaetes bacterium]|nr:helix-turn-helix transcriptional regulator [Spirochaetota bacterium]
MEKLTEFYQFRLYNRNPFHLIVSSTTLNKDFHSHTHSASELIVCASGHSTHTIDGVIHSMRTGDVFVIKPGMHHSFSGCKNFFHYNVSFLADMLASSGDDIRREAGYHALFNAAAGGSPDSMMVTLAADDLARARTLLDAIIKECAARRTAYETAVRGLFMEFVVLLVRAYAKRGGALTPHAQIAYIAGYLETNFRERISLDHLVETSGLSRRHFTRLFRKLYEKSPKEYLLDIRIREAAMLLADGERSITEVAQVSGFDDSNYFSRAFSAVTGVSPREYRKKIFPGRDER